MKQRIFSAVIGIAILFTVLIFFDTVLLNIATALVIIMELSEILNITDKFKKTSTTLVSLCFGALIPFVNVNIIGKILPTVCFAFVLIVFITILKHHETAKIDQMGFVLLFTILITFSTNNFVYMRDKFGAIVGLYGILVTLCGAWITDAGAYFVGSAIGKRKLCPNISPKKTVEGVIGGIVFALVAQIAIGVVYTAFCAYIGVTVSIHYIMLMLLSPVMSIVGVIGDLIGSLIKRQYGIKDFGTIMPGHGGALDRFDSVLTVMPLVYNIFLFYPLITVA